MQQIPTFGVLAGQGRTPTSGNGPKSPPPPVAKHLRPVPRLPWVWSEQQRGTRTLSSGEGSMGGGDKGQKTRGYGASPQHWPQPLQLRQAASSRYHIPSPKHFLGEEMSSMLQVWHRAQGPLRGGKHRVGGRTSSLSHAYCQPAKAACPAALNSARDSSCIREGTPPEGPPHHSPRSLLGTDKAACLHTHRWFGSQPGKEARSQPGARWQRDGYRDAGGCGIPMERQAGMGMQCIGATRQLSRSCGMP